LASFARTKIAVLMRKTRNDYLNFDENDIIHLRTIRLEIITIKEFLRQKLTLTKEKTTPN
jgi:hypothetical protein